MIPLRVYIESLLNSIDNVQAPQKGKLLERLSYFVTPQSLQNSNEEIISQNRKFILESNKNYCIC